MSDPRDRLAAALSDRYRLESELGRGGMAVVYLAEDLKHGRKVALKVLRPELASAIGPERFLREIDTAARLSHPHILPLFDSGEADGLLYYVMPYVSGESLRERLDREGPLAVDDALRIIGQVAGALGRAHEQGVVHRDVKPENILFEAGEALVSDFGIARAVDAAVGDRMTQTGLAVGTPTYMSPEQAAGSDEIDARSDIYGLACVAYEMLAGEPPFTAPTPQALLARHAVHEVRPVRELRPEVPPGVGRALERALAKDPADRYATAEEFAGALTEAATARAIAADERRARRARRVRGLAAVAVLAILALGGWWISTSLGGPRFERLAVLPFTDLTNDPEQEYLVLGIHETLRNDLARAGIPVTARQSVMQFAGTDTPIREIARRLGVDAVIDGTLMPSEDSLVISTELIDGRTEEPVWLLSRAADLSNVLSLYRDVSRAIVTEVRRSLTSEQEARLADRPPVDPEAYRAYMRGVVHAERFTAADFDAAMDYFERAIDIDPEYARAHLGIATVWSRRALNGFVSGLEARRQGEPHLRRALATDSTLAEGHEAVAGFTVWIDWDWEAGRAAYERATRLDPGSAEARVLYAHLLSILGRWDEAREQAARAVELDPLNPFIRGLYGVQRWLARRNEEAIENLEEAMRMDPGGAFARPTLAAALFGAGRPEESFRIWREEFEARGGSELVAALDSGYAAGGLAGAWKAAADAMAAQDAGYVTPIEIAVFHARSGQLEAALDWIDRAIEERDPNTPYIGVLPVLEPLHDEPRFREATRQLGLSILEGPPGPR